MAKVAETLRTIEIGGSELVREMVRRIQETIKRRGDEEVVDWEELFESRLRNRVSSG